MDFLCLNLEKKKGTGDYMNKNQNIRFNIDKESDIMAWESLHSNEVGEKFKSQNRFVIEEINYYYERVMLMQEDPYLETREKEDAFAERTKLEKPVIKVASRNMFYDESGKHVRTKKEIMDASGNIRNGCKIIRKGEVYEKKEFSIKDDRFKQDSFLDEAKVFFTNEINQLVLHEEDKLKVFDKNSPYLATKKIGKNNPMEEQIKADNEVR